MSYSWPEILTGLVRSEGLEAEAAEWALNEIFNGRADDIQLAALLVALRAKGETEDEIAGLSAAMLANATPIRLNDEAVDVVGTGGDRANTVNISTMAAIVAATTRRQGRQARQPRRVVAGRNRRHPRGARREHHAGPEQAGRSAE